MDKYIYQIGDAFCSLLEKIGLYKLNITVGCNGYDNYNIGLFVIIFLFFLIFGRGFFVFWIK